jgi:hypothetical protein
MDDMTYLIILGIVAAVYILFVIVHRLYLRRKARRRQGYKVEPGESVDLLDSKYQGYQVTNKSEQNIYIGEREKPCR